MKTHFISATTIILLSWINSSLAAPLPQKIGTCTQSFVKEISYRLSSPDSNGVYIPVPESGSTISFTNGGRQVSYKNIPAIHIEPI